METTSALGVTSARTGIHTYVQSVSIAMKNNCSSLYHVHMVNTI
jgi:hypothetical protein